MGTPEAYAGASVVPRDLGPGQDDWMSFFLSDSAEISEHVELEGCDVDWLAEATIQDETRDGGGNSPQGSTNGPGTPEHSFEVADGADSTGLNTIIYPCQPQLSNAGPTAATNQGPNIHIQQDCPGKLETKPQTVPAQCSGEDSEETSQTYLLEDGTEETEQKRQARLLRNRESAQLSRHRKKVQLDDLERRCRGLQSQNSELHSLVARLAADNSALRQQLAMYANQQQPLGPPMGASAATGAFGQPASARHMGLLPLGPDGRPVQPKVPLPPLRGSSPASTKANLLQAVAPPLPIPLQPAPTPPLTSIQTTPVITPASTPSRVRGATTGEPRKKKVKRDGPGLVKAATAVTTLFSIFSFVFVSFPFQSQLGANTAFSALAVKSSSALRYDRRAIGRVLTSLEDELAPPGLNTSRLKPFNDSANWAATELAKTTLQAISASNESLTVVNGSEAVELLREVNRPRGMRWAQVHKQQQKMPKKAEERFEEKPMSTIIPYEAMPEHTRKTVVTDMQSLALSRWAAEGHRTFEEGKIPWMSWGSSEGFAGMMPASCTEVFQFEADAATDPRKTDQHLSRHVSAPSSVKGPRALEQRWSDGSWVALPAQDEPLDSSADTGVPPSEEAPRIPDGTSGAPSDKKVGARVADEFTSADQSNIVVSMLVPPPEKVAKEEQANSLSQVFVMVFMAQQSKYVTFACHLPHVMG